MNGRNPCVTYDDMGNEYYEGELVLDPYYGKSRGDFCVTYDGMGYEYFEGELVLDPCDEKDECDDMEVDDDAEITVILPFAVIFRRERLEREARELAAQKKREDREAMRVTGNGFAAEAQELFGFGTRRRRGPLSDAILGFLTRYEYRFGNNERDLEMLRTIQKTVITQWERSKREPIMLREVKRRIVGLFSAAADY